MRGSCDREQRLDIIGKLPLCQLQPVASLDPIRFCRNVGLEIPRSSPVRYRTCVVMYTACLCSRGDLSWAPTTFVCLPSITAGRAAPNVPY